MAKPRHKYQILTKKNYVWYKGQNCLFFLEMALKVDPETLDTTDEVSFQPELVVESVELDTWMENVFCKQKMHF